MKYLEALLLSVLVVFAPIKAAVITVAALTMLDMALGILAARKRGEPITSSGFKRTVGKIALYETALCMGFLVQQYLTGDIFPASKLIAALVGLVECSSILENLDTLNGSPLFKSILTRIVQSQADIEKKP